MKTSQLLISIFVCMIAIVFVPVHARQIELVPLDDHSDDWVADEVRTQDYATIRRRVGPKPCDLFFFL